MLENDEVQRGVNREFLEHFQSYTKNNVALEFSVCFPVSHYLVHPCH